MYRRKLRIAHRSLGGTLCDDIVKKFSLLFCLQLLAVYGFSQQNPELKTLPVEVEYTIRGIEIKIKFHSISIQEKGAFSDMTLSFKNPQTGEWVEFDAKNAEISMEHGLIYSFILQLNNNFRNQNTDFTKPVLEHKSDNTFRWKCDCNEMLHPVF